MRVFAVAIASALACSAASADDLDDCRQTRSPEARIRGCSAIIAARGVDAEDKALAHRNRASARSNAGALTLAIADYTESLRLRPNNIQALSGRGLARFTAGDIEGAINDYDLAIGLASSSAQLRLERGHIRLARGDADGAIADITEAIRLNPKSAVAYNNRGLAYRKKGDFDQARSDYTQAIALNPIYANAYANRGLAYEAQKHKQDAIPDLRYALQLDPSLTEVRAVLQRLGSSEPILAESQRRVASGKALLQKNCSRCHAVGKSGASPNWQAPEFWRLHQRHPLMALREPLTRAVMATHDEMPKFALTESDVDNILAYINSLSAGK